jgi:hypothetical protein
MAQYEQLNLFDPAPYIVSQLAVNRIKLAIVKDEPHDQSRHRQLELEFPSEANDESGDFRLAA